MSQKKSIASDLHTQNLDWEKKGKETIGVFDQPLIYPITERKLRILIVLSVMIVFIISALVYVWYG